MSVYSIACGGGQRFGGDGVQVAACLGRFGDASHHFRDAPFCCLSFDNTHEAKDTRTTSDRITKSRDRCLLSLSHRTISTLPPYHHHKERQNPTCVAYAPR
ncbi:unnamed protein product [Ectocarpus fasciculatus]